MKNQLHQFLCDKFPGLPLRPPLFYSWKCGIRFEIANPEEPFSSKQNLKQMEQRIRSLFDRLFHSEDLILFVTDVHTERSNTYQTRPLTIYRKYVKSKESLYKLQHTVLPDVFGHDEEAVTHRFILPCRKSEIRFPQLLKAISYKDFGSPYTTILKKNWKSGYNCYFINLTRGIIFHLYDDRGCDVIAADRSALLPLYEQYNHWILNYDRKAIDKVFASDRK